MPVSAITAKLSEKEEGLRVPQARILSVLMPENEDDKWFDWPVYPRSELNHKAGYTEMSGSVTRALNGIRETNQKSGKKHKGLIARGLVEAVEIELADGVDTGYRITRAGIDAMRAHNKPLPKMRDTAHYTNRRYIQQSDDKEN